MFVYLHGAKSGHNLAMAFHKADKAADYVITQVDTYIGGKAILGKKLSLKKAIAAQAAAARPAPQHFIGEPDEPGMPEWMDNPPLQAQAPAPNNFWQPQPVFVVGGVAAPLNLPTEKKKVEEKKFPELEALLAHMEIARKNRTFENAVKALELYEEYAKYALNADAALHTLQEIKIVE
jgi:hypothetical protein